MGKSVRIFFCSFFVTMLFFLTLCGILVAGYRTRARLYAEEEPPVLVRLADDRLTVTVLGHSVTVPIPTIDRKPIAVIWNRFPGLVPKPIRLIAYILRE